MARRVLIWGNGAALLIVMVWGLLAVFMATDREAASNGLQGAARELAAFLESSSSKSEAELRDKQGTCEDFLGRYPERRHRMQTASIELYGRIEWSGAPPAFSGTQLVALNPNGEEVARLTIRDLRQQDWQVETTSPLLFWR
jgi:hypothetical protein